MTNTINPIQGLQEPSYVAGDIGGIGRFAIGLLACLGVIGIAAKSSQAIGLSNALLIPTGGIVIWKGWKDKTAGKMMRTTLLVRGVLEMGGGALLTAYRITALMGTVPHLNLLFFHVGVGVFSGAFAMMTVQFLQYAKSRKDERIRHLATALICAASVGLYAWTLHTNNLWINIAFLASSLTMLAVDSYWLKKSNEAKEENRKNTQIMTSLMAAFYAGIGAYAIVLATAKHNLISEIATSSITGTWVLGSAALYFRFKKKDESSKVEG